MSTLQHIVLFSFPAPLTEEDAATMRQLIADWPSKIGGMSKLRFGTDLTGARTRGYQYLLYMQFPSTEELVKYQQHPVHLEFFAWVSARDCTPLAFDYYLDSDTLLIDE
jgi:hypothetical protein